VPRQGRAAGARRLPREDKDNDGIVDEKDKCPDEPETRTSSRTRTAAPIPTTTRTASSTRRTSARRAETKNGYQDDDGCPDEVPAPVKKFTGVVKGITFRRNSADIKPSSFPLLKEAVGVFKEYPTLRVEISGHTSDEGKRDFNMKLSRKRAEAVKAFLTSAGIDESRIGTVGYGPDKPIADNETKEGKEKNRRIEFRLLGPRRRSRAQPEPEDINPSPDREKQGQGGRARPRAGKGGGEGAQAKAKKRPRAGPRAIEPKAEGEGRKAKAPPTGRARRRAEPADRGRTKPRPRTRLRPRASFSEAAEAILAAPRPLPQVGERKRSGPFAPRSRYLQRRKRAAARYGRSCSCASVGGAGSRQGANPSRRPGDRSPRCASRSPARSKCGQ
jgi:outer membrane protein OmpA-like peptidoglycan-associated protein